MMCSSLPVRAKLASLRTGMGASGGGTAHLVNALAVRASPPGATHLPRWHYRGTSSAGHDVPTISPKVPPALGWLGIDADEIAGVHYVTLSGEIRVAACRHHYGD